MKRLPPILGLFVAALVCSAESAPKKPNVLFLVVDDLRTELGCYGSDYIKSPNIDGLAGQGMTFNRAYVQQAVCSPSRTAVLTGLRPDSTKVWDLVTHFRDAQPKAVTLLQNFKSQGYFVQGMGKIFHGSLDDAPSWSVPWQRPAAPIYASPKNAALSPTNVETEPDDPAPPAKVKVKKKKEKKAAAAADDEGGKKGAVYECVDVPDNTYLDGKVADLAVKTLQELGQKDQPFFLAVGFSKPHLPWVSPKKYWDLYDEAAIALAPNPFYPKDAPDYAIRKFDGEIFSYQGVPAKGQTFSADFARKLKHAYYAGISYTDAQIGRVLAELNQLGLDKNTLIVLWGDHGWKLGEHGSWGKHSNVENDANAPLIFSFPGMKQAGVHSDALVEFVDIYPTLSDLAGLSVPATLEGISAKPVLDDPKLPWKKAAFSQYPRNTGKTGLGSVMGYPMRTERYRFTVCAGVDDHSKIDAVELYDHLTDPQENTNIAKLAANAALVAQLMTQWQKGWQGAVPAGRPSL
jgi:arylsulfatase A-like enzyme